MDPPPVSQLTPEERLIAGAIRWTWVFYVLGALYVVGPVVGWGLAAMAVVKAWREPDRLRRVSPNVWVWVVGMLVMELALVAGHVDFDLGTAQIVKSTIGWAKGWALMATFIAAGAILDVRPVVVADAIADLARQTVLLTPFFVLAFYAGLPERLYISPVSIVGGPGPEYFSFNFYSIDPSSGMPRWHFFLPWAPAAGFVAILHVTIAMAASNRRKIAWAVVSAILIALLTKSRLAILALLLVPFATWLLCRLTRPAMALAAGGIVPALAMLWPWLSELIADATNAFHSARADSSRVREALGRIALDRWQDEAPVWGHGVVERGPHLVQYMPIGSHHTWYGLLFTKGAVGLAALVIPMATTSLELLWRAQHETESRIALAVMLVIFLYTFGENINILAYQLWPGLVIIGIALKRRSTTGPTPIPA